MHGEQMIMDPSFLQERAKRIGLSIKESRLSKGLDIDDISQATGISSDSLEAFENGEISPSLPELELLAYLLRTPLDSLIDGDISKTEVLKQINPNQFKGIRHRIIGTRLRQTRIEADLSLEDISQKTGIDIDTLQAYETGAMPIPYPQFEYILSNLTASMRDFQDKHGPIGEWLTHQQEVNEFLQLPDEIRNFITRPINIPYLELAMRLSEMSVDKLRAVAEGLLEITL